MKPGRIYTQKDTGIRKINCFVCISFNTLYYLFVFLIIIIAFRSFIFTKWVLLLFFSVIIISLFLCQTLLIIFLNIIFIFCCLYYDDCLVVEVSTVFVFFDNFFFFFSKLTPFSPVLM